MTTQMGQHTEARIPAEDELEAARRDRESIELAREIIRIDSTNGN